MALAVLGFGAGTASAQVPITTLGTPVTENFDSLLKTGGTHSEVPAGWSLLETGANADQKYGVSTGGGNTADSYSFGANNGTDRAFGSVASGSLETAIGARFINNGGASITAFAIDYTGEWWHGGDASSDPIVFEYSLNATNLSAGTWVAVTALDFNHLDVPCQASSTCGAGATKDGNAAGFRAAKSATISGVAIATGASFWIRWRDTNATGADQGLAIDDFSLTANPVFVPEPVVEIVKDVKLVSDPIAVPGAALEYSFLISVDASSPQGVTNFVLTDTLPETVNAVTSPVDPSYVFSIEGDELINLTAAADGDVGEIVNGVVTVRVSGLAIDSLTEVKFRVSIAKATTAFTLANVGSATFDGATAGTGFEVDSSEALIAVIACESAADCNDDNACTSEACDAGSCVATPAAGDCDDANPCTTGDTCAAGECKPGVSDDCNDGNVCTTDRCDALLGCVNEANTVTCDDGDITTTDDHCDGSGTCIGTEAECPTDPTCGHYTFDGTTCVLTATTGACDDGNPCTTADTCGENGCGGEPLCDIGETCDNGTCTPPVTNPEVTEPAAEAAPEVTEPTPEPTPEATPEPTPEATPEPGPEAAEVAEAGGDTGPNFVDGKDDGCAGGGAASVMGLGLLAVFVLRRRMLIGG